MSRRLRPLTLLQRLAGWTALATLLLGALLPARAMPVEEAYALLGLDICSAAQAGQRDDGGGSPRHAAGDHCSACWLNPAPGLPPASLPGLVPPAPDRAEAPARFSSAPRRLHVWASARSRAPPAAG